jgi:hypothetical protein
MTFVAAEPKVMSIYPPGTHVLVAFEFLVLVSEIPSNRLQGLTSRSARFGTVQDPRTPAICLAPGWPDPCSGLRAP